MLPKAILLDMDDTIMALEQGVDVDVCWKTACASHLNGWDDTAIGDLIRSIRQQASWYWSDAERHRVGRLDLTKARTAIIEAAFAQRQLPDLSPARRIASDFGDLRDQAVVLFPGAWDTVEFIHSLGIKTALLTNGASAAQRWKINRFALDRLFEHIWIEEEFGVGKPDERIYLHAMIQLGALPEETWMVGDNYEWEVAAPQRLGIRGVWINHKNVDPAAMPVPPFASIRTLSELVPLLQT